MENLSELIQKVLVASFAAVGIVEYIKNFLKTEKTWIYSVIMPFAAVGCFFAIEKLPFSVVGGILTVGTVQLNYQIIIQGFKKIIENVSDKIEIINTKKTESA